MAVVLMTALGLPHRTWWPLGDLQLGALLIEASSAEQVGSEKTGMLQLSGVELSGACFLWIMALKSEQYGEWVLTASILCGEVDGRSHRWSYPSVLFPGI